LKLDPGFGWTLNDYSGSIQSYLENGYKVTSFAEYLTDPATKHLILRHDVDFALEPALKIGKLDAELGATSSFYFRVHAKNYNLFSVQGLSTVDHLMNLGHEVALHLEEGIERIGQREKWANLDGQKDSFEKLLGIKIKGFAAHEPVRFGGFQTSDEAKVRWELEYHSYESKFTNEMKYLSDSSGRWRERPFQDYVNEYQKLQVLIHPIWWFENTPQENY
jgi:hypothetical protein